MLFDAWWYWSLPLVILAAGIWHVMAGSMSVQHVRFSRLFPYLNVLLLLICLWMVWSGNALITPPQIMAVHVLIFASLYHWRVLSRFGDRNLTAQMVGMAHMVLGASIVGIYFFPQNFHSMTAPWRSFADIFLIQQSSQQLQYIWLSLGAMLFLDSMAIVVLGPQKFRFLSFGILRFSSSLVMFFVAIVAVSGNVSWAPWCEGILAFALVVRLGTLTVPALCRSLEKTSLLAVSPIFFASHLTTWWWLLAFDWHPFWRILFMMMAAFIMISTAFVLAFVDNIRTVANSIALACVNLPLMAFCVRSSLQLPLVLSGLWLGVSVLIAYSLLMASLSWDNRISSTGGLWTKIPVLGSGHLSLLATICVFAMSMVAVTLVNTAHTVVVAPFLMMGLIVFFWQIINVGQKIFVGSWRGEDAIFSRIYDLKLKSFLALLALVILATVSAVLSVWWWSTAAISDMKPFVWPLLAPYENKKLAINLLISIVLIAFAAWRYAKKESSQP